MKPSGPAAAHRGERTIVIGLVSLALAGLALALGIYGYAYFFGPRIDKLEPVVVDPGGSVTISGKHFGIARGDSRVEIDGVSPTASSYVDWGTSSITLRLPPGAESGLIYVVTRVGRSNAKLFMNRARLPVPPQGASQSRTGPYISSLSSESGPIGSLLIISGLNFGSNREHGAVLFGWSPEGSSSGPEDRSDNYVSNADVDLGYELWSDKEIRVRVPDGASSGGIIVSAETGKSNAVFFSIADMPGQKRYKDRRSYSLSYSVSLTNVRASGPNELDLWVPRPLESASQRVARILAQDPPPFVPDYRGAALYQFKNLTTGGDVAVAQSYLVQVWGVETEADPDEIHKPDDPPALYTAYTAADELVPADAPEVQALSKKITQGEKNPWRIAHLVYEYLVKNVVWSDSPVERKPVQALTQKKADSTSYALASAALLRASGVPALPVKGYLVDSSRKAVRHAWVEFYIYGLGWVPMDPILGAGASPGGIAVSFDDRSRYFGNLDDHHLVFSRGNAVFAPMSPAGRFASPAKPFAFQSCFEEASGQLDAYSSFWSDVEVSGLY